MAGELPSHAILVARVNDPVEVARIVELALEEGLAMIPLAATPQAKGPFPLELYSKGMDGPLLLSALIVSAPENGLTCCQVKPLNDGQRDAFRRLLSQRAPAPAATPPTATASAATPNRPAHDADRVIGRTLAGKYVVEGALGAGGMGRVYKARHVALDRPVAVKLLHGNFQRDPLFIARFHREARAASKLDHPNVARVLDFGEDTDGLLYIVMELLVGDTLRTALDEIGALPLPRVVALATQICAGISAAHDEGIVHRDIKPGNVVLVRGRDDEGQSMEVVKVCDFGLATIEDSGDTTAPGKGNRAHTAAGAVCGTPDYMAPEQGRGETVDTRTDIYTLGAMLYEMVTGRLPFERATPIAAVMAHIMEEPKPPSSLRPELDGAIDAVILKAMQKDPAKRYQTIRELRADLRAITRPGPAAAPQQVISGLRPAPAETAMAASQQPPPRLSVPDLEVPPAPASKPPSDSALRAAPVKTPMPFDRNVPLTTPMPFERYELPTTPTAPNQSTPRLSFIQDSVVSVRPGEQSFSGDDDADTSGLELAVPQRTSWAANARPAVTVAAPAHHLSDPASRFSELFIEIAKGVDRVSKGGLDRMELQRTLVAVVRLAEIVLRARGELGFARRDVHDATKIVVTGTANESIELQKSLPPGVGQAYATVFSDLFVRRRILAFTMKEGVGVSDFTDLVELLGGIEDEGLKNRLKISTRISVLFPPDLLGRQRALPWVVDLALSRMANDLKAIARAPGKEDRIVERSPVAVAEVVRGTTDPQLLRTMFDHLDLVEAAVEGVLPRQAVDLRHAMLFSVPTETAVALARAALGELSTEGAQPAAPRRVLEVLGRRFVKERSPESDLVLVDLGRRGLIGTAEIPEDLRTTMALEEYAERVARAPDRAAAKLDAAPDLAHYANDTATLGRVAPILARRGEIGALHVLLTRLHRDSKASQGAEAARQPHAAQALRAFTDPVVVSAVADGLLTGAPWMRDAARALTIAFGMSGVRAVCGARKRAGPDRLVRTRFIDFLRELGPRILPAIAEALAAADVESNDPAVVSYIEDLLRAVPAAANDATGHQAARLCAHPAAVVRRAATAALASLLGPRARGSLLSQVDDRDDGVRIAALTGLRTLQAIDSDAVTRIDRILGGTVPASDELRAVAAAVLGDATPAARSSAGIVLRRAFEPKARRLFAGEQPEDALLLESIAKSLIALGGEEGRRVVEQRAAKSAPDVRERLSKLLARQPSG